MDILYTVLVSHCAVMSFCSVNIINDPQKLSFEISEWTQNLGRYQLLFYFILCHFEKYYQSKKLRQNKLHSYNMTIHAATKWVRPAMFDAGIDDSTSSLLPTRTVFVQMKNVHHLLQ